MVQPNLPGPRVCLRNALIRGHVLTVFSGEWSGWAPSEGRMYYENRQMAKCFRKENRNFLQSLRGGDWEDQRLRGLPRQFR
jgi:hypothetical protein